MNMHVVSILLLLCLTTACRKKDPPQAAITDQETNRQLTLSFEHEVDGKPLKLNSENYLNDNGDTFSVSGYAYYISNISLISADGKSFRESESYHLITETDTTSRSFVIKNIPAGNYTSIQFLIGVDEARNTGGAQTGALDPMHGMFWDWNTGYIMAKMEGFSPQSTAPAKALAFHIGGFEGPNSVLRRVTLPFPSNVTVTDHNHPEIHLSSNLAEWFRTPNRINFSELNIILGTGSTTAWIADNYTDMFTVKHVHN